MPDTLNYKYLNSLGIDYHFYRGRYFDALKEVLDSTKKTIVHIPNMNSMESSGQKLVEVDRVLDVLGTVQSQDPDTGIYIVKTRQGKLIRVADLVTDDTMRVKVLNYLHSIKSAGDMDVIIALVMANEGFNWPWCEHVVTVGYPSSFTEIMQIVRQASHDCEGKTDVQFTNLIELSDANNEDIKTSFNNMLNAITQLPPEEQDLAPNITFKPQSPLKNREKTKPGTIIISDTERPISERVKKILKEGGLRDVVTATVQDMETIKPLVTRNYKE